MSLRTLVIIATVSILWGCASFQKSANDQPVEVRFTVLGDSQFANQDVWEQMIHEVDMLRPDFVIQVGDLIHGYTYDVDRLREEWRRYQHQIAPLQSPFYPVPGNHDVVTDESEAVYGEVWGPDRYHYSFDQGPVHVIVLDTYWQDEDDRIEEWQRNWMAEDLANYAAQNGGIGSEELASKSIFVFMHAPLFRYAADTPGRQDWNQIHEMLRQYPTRLVVAGHTHEYVWENRDGIDYLVINSSGGMGGYLERGGIMHCQLNVSVLSNGDVRYAVIKPDSVLPIDTVDNHDRSTVPRYNLHDGTIRLEEWNPGEPLEAETTISLQNSLPDLRTYHLEWRFPRGADAVTVEPREVWVDLAQGASQEVTFSLTADDTPEAQPWLQITSDQEFRTGVVSRDWENRYRSDIEAAETDPSIITTHIHLDAPVHFSASHRIFVPPVVHARRVTGDITIDGVFDDADWQEAEVIDDFQTSGAADPDVTTEVRLLYDDDHLLVAARMGEPNPDQMSAVAHGDIPLTWNDDDLELYFDPRYTQTEYSRLFQNVAGTRFNSLPRYIEDKYFESTYESAIQIGEDYWTLEMRIPWSEMYAHRPAVSGDRWGFQVGRHRPQSEPSEYTWNGTGLYGPSRYGILEFE